MAWLRQHAALQSDVCAHHLARLATRSLLAEARLTPKPGLVDRRGSGAHADMTLALLERSAHSLTPAFYRLAVLSWQRQPDCALRQQTGYSGREAEAQMLRVTGGVNTHRGAIWALGLLVCGAAMCGGSGSAREVVAAAASLARLPDVQMPRQFSKGQHVRARYRLPGAREEAQQGFPHVTGLALPQLHKSRQQGASQAEAQLDALLAIMTSLSDTCILSRAGLNGLYAVQQLAQAVLTAGGASQPDGRRALMQLEQRMLADNSSPGGAADLLAATLFLEQLSPGDGTAVSDPGE